MGSADAHLNEDNPVDPLQEDNVGPDPSDQDLPMSPSDYQGYAKPWGIAEGYSKGRGKGTRLLPLTYPYPSEGYILYPSEG